ncbi:ROK family protein [Acrocarpospora catenulata]|uniref:ROK family protein n=1 Tax=Acrocarpospora catenulata TaxID=2836182 RepID=UPI001BD98C7D|nr:ROK family protein [Acrocarpospora catenulata]
MSAPVVAMDVGGTFIKGAVVTGMITAGRPPAVRRWATGADGGVTGEELLGRIAAVARELIGRCREEEGAAPAAVGVAIPGLVEEERGRSVRSVNLGWRDLEVRQRLEKDLGIPVRVCHDVRAGGVAEARAGAATGRGTAAFVPVGTGIAAALLTGGRPMPGAHFAAGEIGHLPVRAGTIPCPCGRKGCIEAVASASAIARRYREMTGTDATAAQVADLAAGGSDPARRIWDDAVQALADGLSFLTHTFDPEVVVIGGGLAKAGPRLLAPLREAMRARALDEHHLPQVVPAAFSDHAGCAGAALLARETI